MKNFKSAHLIGLTVSALLVLSACGDKKKTDNRAFNTAPGQVPVAPTGAPPIVNPPSLLGDSLRDVRVQVDAYRNEFRVALTFEDWETGTTVYVGALQGAANLQTATVLNFVPNYPVDAPFYARTPGEMRPVAAAPMQQEIGQQFSGLLTCTNYGCSSANIQITRVSSSGETQALLQYQKFNRLDYRTQFYGNNGRSGQYQNNQYPYQYYNWLNQGNNNMNLAVVDVIGSGKQFFQLESDYYNPSNPYSPFSARGNSSRQSRVGSSSKGNKNEAESRAIRISGGVGKNSSLFFRPEVRKDSTGKVETTLIKNQEANVSWDSGSQTLRIEFTEKNKKRVVVEATASKDPGKHDSQLIENAWPN